MRQMFLLIAISAGTLAANSHAEAQEAWPIVISERLQEIAREYPIVERLEIVWSDSTIVETGEYLGLLASAEVVAREIASRTERGAPRDSDYHIALAAFCLFPPNKPAIGQEFWGKQMAAFYDEEVRDLLREAIGPRMISLAESIEELGEGTIPAARFADAWPIDQVAYFAEVFNAPLLETGR